MFLFWYYIHIPIKNIMCLRGIERKRRICFFTLREKEPLSLDFSNRKAKDSQELETFQKGERKNLG